MNVTLNLDYRYLMGFIISILFILLISFILTRKILIENFHKIMCGICLLCLFTTVYSLTMYFVYDIVLVPDTIKMLLMSKRGDIILLPKTTKLFNVMGMVFYMLGNVIGFIVFMGFIVEKIYKEKEKNK